MRDWWRELRLQQGQRPAPEVALSLALIQRMARLTWHWQHALLTPDTLTMLVAGNCAPADDMREWLQREPRSIMTGAVETSASVALLVWRIRWALRLSLAAVWLGTAVVSFGLYPVQGSLALLAGVGLHGYAALVALYGAAGLDLLLGLMTLFNPLGRRLWQLQALLILVYTAILSLALPQFWLHPFAPLLKNLPVLAALAVLALTEDSAHE